MIRRARVALVSVLLAGVWVVIPQSAHAADDGNIEIGVEIAPLSTPTELVKTGTDAEPLLLGALALGATGAVAIALSRRRAQPSAQLASISAK